MFQLTRWALNPHNQGIWDRSAVHRPRIGIGRQLQLQLQPVFIWTTNIQQPTWISNTYNTRHWNHFQPFYPDSPSSTQSWLQSTKHMDLNRQRGHLQFITLLQHPNTQLKTPNDSLLHSNYQSFSLSLKSGIQGSRQKSSPAVALALKVNTWTLKRMQQESFKLGMRLPSSHLLVQGRSFLLIRS